MWTRITSIERSTEPTIVYNLEVEGNHNYFVGEIGVLSHNCDAIKQTINVFKGLAKPAEKIAGADWNKVDELIGAMRKAGGWVGNPAITTRINGQLYLVDGHHRVTAAIDSGFDVVYKEVPFSDLASKYNLFWGSEDDIVRSAQRTGGFSTRP